MRDFRRKLKFLPLLFLLPIFFTINACKKKEPARAQQIPEAVKSYVYAYTAGVISKNDPVRVRFSGAVATAEMIGEEANDDILGFQPSAKGTAFWEDDHTLRFEPKNGWEASTAYIGKVDLGEVFTNLPEDARHFEFDFLVRGQSLTVEVVSVESEGGDLAKQVLTGDLFTTDAADSDDVQDVLTVRQEGNSLPVEWTHSDDGTVHRFLVRDIQRGNDETEVVIDWNGKHIGVQSSDQIKVKVPALGDFSVAAARVVNGENQFVEFQFSDPLRPVQDLNGLIAVRNTGEGGNDVNLNFTIDGNRVLVYPQSRLAGMQTFESTPWHTE